MKRFLAILLTVLTAVSAFSVCAEEADGWTLETADSVLKLTVEDNQPVIESLISKANGKNSIVPSGIVLPELYSADNIDSHFCWTYTGAARTDADGLDVLTLYFEDADAQTEYRFCVSAHTKIPGPFEVWAELENLGSGKISFEMKELVALGLSMDEPATLYKIAKESGQAEGWVSASGSCIEGTGIHAEEMSSKSKHVCWTTANQNWNSGGQIPIIYIDMDGNSGIYTALEFPYGQIWARGQKDGGEDTINTRVSVVLGYEAKPTAKFRTKVEAGDTFLVPTTYVGVYDGNLDHGSNQFKNWFFACKVPDNLRENEDEPYTQTDMQIDAAVSASLNVESVKWDYGWWSDGLRGSLGNWNPYEGSWILRSDGYRSWLNLRDCATMADFGDWLKTVGIKNWTVYVLLHDTLGKNGEPVIVEGSEFNSVSHPEWFSSRRVDDGMGKCADLGNEECVAYLQEALKEFFTANNIGTWRTDFEPIATASHNDNRHSSNGTDVQYWTATGFYEILDYLIENIEGFRYESCCSGGALKDFATLCRATIINTEDTANYLSERMAFYDSSYAVHPTQLQMPINPDTFCKEAPAQFWPVIETEMENAMMVIKDYGMRTCILGAPMVASWSGPKDVMTYRFSLNKYIREYYGMYIEKVRPIQRSGELYHILPRPDGVNWDGVMYADPDTANEIKGVVFLFKPSAVEDVRRIVMDGLNADVSYQLTFEDDETQNVICTGEELMENGIDVIISGDVGSEIIWITEAI